MAIATGVGKRIVYKKESTWATAPGTGSGQILRRVSSSLDLSKATYESAEIASNYQITDMRHGARSVAGDIKGELSPGTYKDFMGSALRKVFATGATSGALTTVAAAAGSPGTFTRSAGSWLTDGFKVGDIVRVTGYTTTGVSNNTKNFRISALTATVMTVYDIVGSLGTSSVATKAAGDSVTFSVTGKKTWVPTTGHVDGSYYIAHEHSDISVYDIFSGCKVSMIDMNMPSTGMAEISIGFMGADMSTSGSAYYVSPTAATTAGVLAGVNGRLIYGGTEQGIVTGLQLKIDGGMSTGTVVGSNTTPDIFEGRVRVSGSLTAYFQDSTLVSAFLNETTPSLSFCLTTDNTSSADFINVVLPKIKLGSATRTDGEQGLTLQANFTALYNSAGGTGIDSEATTISIQDSLA